MATHELKTWPEPFAAVLLRLKHHEVRKSDRSFVIGDTLLLREYDPSYGRQMPGELPEPRGYTGRELRCRVTYISRGGTWGLPPDLCVMSIEVLP